MALGKILARRLLSSSSFSLESNQKRLQQIFRPSEHEHRGMFQQLLQVRTVFHSAAKPGTIHPSIVTTMIEKLPLLKGDRTRFQETPLNFQHCVDDTEEVSISVRDAKKLLWFSQLQVAKEAVRNKPEKSISYSEFISICKDCLIGVPSDDEAVNLARKLDESGVVIVLGPIVFLRPEQVAREIQKAIQLPLPSSRMDDLEKMEMEIYEIDRRAESLVRRELWAGLCFLVLQTAGFMRLTFWELSWDVMEPICFYVTSFYFMAGYTFFLRTSKDPSFEGFFQSRFAAKQKKLMKAKNFDVEKFNSLRRTLGIPRKDSPFSIQRCHYRPSDI